MNQSALLLSDFNAEMSTTRRVLERIPDDRLGWQPHEKSMSLSRLGSHLAELPVWGSRVLDADRFDMAARIRDYKPLMLGSRAEILELFDTNVAQSRGKLEAADDATLAADWSLTRGDEAFRTMPRIAALRSMMIHHIIHHRGQLSVYLRLLDVPVPSIYGSSADEKLFG